MKFEFYGMYLVNSKGTRELRWAWRLRADNGKVVAHHNQGYNSKSQMIKILRNIFRESPREEELEAAIGKVVPRGDMP